MTAIRSERSGDMKNEKNRKIDEDDVTDVIAGAVVGGFILAGAYVANSLHHPTLSEEKRQQLRIKKKNKDN